MAGLLEKIKSLPQTNRVYFEGEGSDNTAQGETSHEEHQTPPETKPEAAQPEKKVEAEKPVEEAIGDVEPPKNAPKAEKDAYRERRLKAADEEKADAKREAAELKKELEREKQEKADWKRQAETVAQRPQQPRTEAAQPAKAETLPDITKDPVGHLSQRLEQNEQRYKSLEDQNTNDRAFRELESLESAYAQKNPEHTDVMKFGEDESVKRNMLLNPNANEKQLRDNFKASKLDTVVKLMRSGLSEDAAVAKVHEMTKIIFGYQPKAAPVVVEDKTAAEKAKFAAVQKNKAKSGSGLAAGGSSANADRVGNARTNPLPLKEIAKLTKEQKNAYYAD